MSSILVGRTRARSQAIQILFQADFKGVDVYDLVGDDSSYVLDDGPADEYALELARGVARCRLSIDRILQAVSQNWNLYRMPLVDRIIMAIAIYEMFDEDEVPVSVAISEAVEIAKVYGTDDSSSFVNGILGRIARLQGAHPDVDLSHLADFADEADQPMPAVPAQAQDAADGDAQAEVAADGDAQDLSQDQAAPDIADQPGETDAS